MKEKSNNNVSPILLNFIVVIPALIAQMWWMRGDGDQNIQMVYVLLTLMVIVVLGGIMLRWLQRRNTQKSTYYKILIAEILVTLVVIVLRWL